MNEIQAVKTAKIEEVKKNSKKGFTLVELVVVIAILAILAAIAIPVVASTITSSQRSSAKSNAQTIEVAIKEADAAISAKDDTVFVNKAGAATADQFKASSGSLTLKNIAEAKAIDSAVEATYQINGVNYSAYYDNNTQKVVFLGNDGTNTVDVDGKTYTAGTNTVLLTDATSGKVDATVKFNGTGKADGKTGAAPTKKS